MKREVFAFALASVLSAPWIFANSADGASFSCVTPTLKGLAASEDCVFFLMDGEIVAGDYERFVDLVRKHFANPPVAFSLQSSGGDAIEAMKIGRLVRKLYLPTAAPTRETFEQMFGAPLCSEGEECLCASACALIWFAGVDRRVAQGVGIHRPRVNEKHYEASNLDDIQKDYVAIDKMVEDYLREMSVDSYIFQIMMQTKPTEIHWLNEEEAKLVEGKVSFLEDYINAKCPIGAKVDANRQYTIDNCKGNDPNFEGIKNAKLREYCKNYMRDFEASVDCLGEATDDLIPEAFYKFYIQSP